MTSTMQVAGWVCLLLATALADPEIREYRKVGDEVVLKLASPATNKITSISWLHGEDIAALWEGDNLLLFRQFKDRGRLDIASGELTMTGLTRKEGGLYTPTVNGAVATPTRLIIISPVATPTVNISCDNETSCILTCYGATTDAEPLTYTWMLGDKVLTQSANEQRITKESDSSASEFSCELVNPVSRERSRPFANPFFTVPDPIANGSVKIPTGVTVFICLLAALLLLVLFHRWKAGAWFFRKDSMPWEAGFWSRNEGQPNPSKDDGDATARPLAH